MSQPLFPDPDPATLPGTPLPERMRPRTLEEVVGQAHLLGPGRPLRQAIDRGALHSLIFWGPPGTGKTTIGRLLADATGAEFVPVSAVTTGIKEVKDVMATAEDRREGRAPRRLGALSDLLAAIQEEKDEAGGCGEPTDGDESYGRPQRLVPLELEPR